MIELFTAFTPTRGTILLDFDGPVCSIFAGKPDYVAAQRLRHVLADHGVALPDDVVAARDPLQVLREHLIPDWPFS